MSINNNIVASMPVYHNIWRPDLANDRCGAQWIRAQSVLEMTAGRDLEQCVERECDPAKELAA